MKTTKDFTVRSSDTHSPSQSNATDHPEKIISQLAREWADHVGGLTQARKVVREAFEAGVAVGARQASTVSANPKERDCAEKLAEALKRSQQMLVACSESAQILKRVDRSGGWQKAENSILDLIHENSSTLSDWEASK